MSAAGGRRGRARRAARREAVPAVTVGNLNLLRCLGGRGFEVVAATSIANRVVFYSRYADRSLRIPGPSAFPEQFVDALIELGADFGDRRPVLFYDGDADLLCISRHRRRLAEHYRFNLPPECVVESLLDKGRFLDFAAERMLGVPPTWVCRAGEEAAAVLHEAAYPVVVKPISRVGWFETQLGLRASNGGKAIRADDAKALRRLLQLSADCGADVVVQAMVLGPESAVASYHCYVSGTGEILGEYTGRKIRTYPREFGMSSCVEVASLPEVAERGREVVRKIDLRGVAKLDFKRDARSGELFLLEINPRFNIWNYAGAAAGVNLPMLAYSDLACSRIPHNPQVRHPVRWVDGRRDALARRLDGSTPPRNGSVFSKTVYNLWSWNDPLPLAAHFGFRIAERMRRVARLAVRL